MRSQTISVARENPNRGMRNMTVDEPLNDSAIKASPPIEFVTDNGFSIARLSELQPSTADSENGCWFLVRQPDGEESQVSVAFKTPVVAQIQSQRKIHLSDTSDFWLTLAEEHLGTYLWKNNHIPADGHLVISRLSGHDLALAARWRD